MDRPMNRKALRGQVPNKHHTTHQNTTPKGSKYHYSRYLGPKSIYYTITWTLWEMDTWTTPHSKSNLQASKPRIQAKAVHLYLKPTAP